MKNSFQAKEIHEPNSAKGLSYRAQLNVWRRIDLAPSASLGMVFTSTLCTSNISLKDRDTPLPYVPFIKSFCNSFGPKYIQFTSLQCTKKCKIARDIQQRTTLKVCNAMQWCLLVEEAEEQKRIWQTQSTYYHPLSMSTISPLSLQWR